MLLVASKYLVIALGVFICGMGLAGIVSPGKFTAWADRLIGVNTTIYFAVLTRLLLGTALILVAAESRFPLVLTVLGWLSIIAAVVLALIGRKGMQRMMRWFIDKTSQAVTRAWLLLAAVFGAFLIYAVV